MNCHTTPPQHNDFGKLVKATMSKQGTPGKLTPDVLQSIEAVDSDRDGWTNGDEARAGFNPGDAKSHPPGQPRSKAPVVPHSSPELVPRHTFHPVIVHFPIALFIFGAFLEFLGKFRRDDVVRNVAFWNLVFGGLATLAAIPTGFIAAFRLGYPLTPGTPVFLHLALGIGAAALMLAVLFWRRTGLVTKPAYWILLAVTALAVGAAGHFGGQLVYG